MILHNELIHLLFSALQSYHSICTYDYECNFNEVCANRQCTQNTRVAWKCKSGVFADPSEACTKVEQLEEETSLIIVGGKRNVAHTALRDAICLPVKVIFLPNRLLVNCINFSRFLVASRYYKINAL